MVTTGRPDHAAPAAEPVLPLLWARGGVLDAHLETVICDILTRASTPTSRATAAA